VENFQARNQKQISVIRDDRLRLNFSNMNSGKRILVKDGRIGFFHNYSGNLFKGDSFDINFNGEVESVSIRDYVCVLIENENVKCPSCQSPHIMDGYLSGNYENREISMPKIPIIFNENTTNTTSANIRSVKSHACYDCGYIMLFALP